MDSHGGSSSGVTEKRCSRCEETKPRSEFHRNRRQGDGLQNSCKTCMAEYGRERNEAAKRRRTQERERQRRLTERDAPLPVPLTKPVFDLAERMARASGAFVSMWVSDAIREKAERQRRGAA